MHGKYQIINLIKFFTGTSLKMKIFIVLSMLICLGFGEQLKFIPKSNDIPKGAPKNVLFLASDDMRPQLGAYIGEDFPTPNYPKMHTPNLDALAKRSMLLKRAYVQVGLITNMRV